MVVFSALPEVGWVSAKNVNKLTQSGKAYLVIPCSAGKSNHVLKAGIVQIDQLRDHLTVTLWQND